MNPVIIDEKWRRYAEGHVQWTDVYPEFQPSEFDSPDRPGSGRAMDMRLVGRLWLVRMEVGAMVIISGGYRTRERQEKLIKQGLTKAKNSLHLSGKAADFYAPSLSVDELFVICEGYGFGGLGIYLDSSFVHGDVRDGGVQRWTRTEGRYTYWF